jgi:hypothetical protein
MLVLLGCRQIYHGLSALPNGWSDAQYRKPIPSLPFLFLLLLSVPANLQWGPDQASALNSEIPDPHSVDIL